MPAEQIDVIGNTETKIDPSPPLIPGFGERVLPDTSSVDNKRISTTISSIPEPLFKEAELELLKKQSLKIPDIGNRFISVLKRSEEISGSDIMRSTALSYLYSGMSAESVTEIILRNRLASKEALDEWFNMYIGGVVRSGLYDDVVSWLCSASRFIPALGNFNIEHDLYSAVWHLHDMGATKPEIIDLVLNSDSFEKFIKWERLGDDSHILFGKKISAAQEFLRQAGVSEESISAKTIWNPIRKHIKSDASNPITKLVYEAHEKVFKPLFGIDYPTYSAMLLKLSLLPGGDKDYFASLENIVGVAEELAQAGIDRDIIIKLASDVLESDLGEVGDFLKLALQKDELVTKYVAEPVPELQAFLSEALNKLRGDGFITRVGDSVKLPSEYGQYSEAQVIASLPKFMSKSINMQGDVLSLKISPHLADKYVFRVDTGELGGGAYGSAFVRSPEYKKIMQDIKTMDKLFDVFVNGKGIGHKATDEAHSGVFVAEELEIAVYSESVGYKETGFWVIDKDALLNVPLKIEEYGLDHPAHETEFADVIPFKYVQYLIVTPENRAAILAKYGADNTEIFGRPLKDVVLEVDKYENWEDYALKFLQTRISEFQ